MPVREVSLLGAPMYMLGLLCVWLQSLSKYRFVVFVVRATIVDVGNLYIRPIDAQLKAAKGTATKKWEKEKDNEKVEEHYCHTTAARL